MPSFSPAAKAARFRPRWRSCGCWAGCCATKTIGRHIVPIVPDEARTFGMESLFRQIGIYSHVGQLYEPVDSDTVLYYREATDGQILEEGITEAGAMSSFIAAGTSHTSHGLSMIPFFIYYSMFGFQRIGDLLWAAGDMRCRGFVLGGTAGRTTLAGEGLQHQDGNSHLNALAYPNCLAYDPCYAYEMAVIVLDGLRRMYYEAGRHLLLHHADERKLRDADPADGLDRRDLPRHLSAVLPRSRARSGRKCNCSAAGPFCANRCAPRRLLEKHFDVGSKVYSVTSYKTLYYDGRECDRWNRLHPADPPRRPYVSQVLQGHAGPVVAALDYVAPSAFRSARGCRWGPVCRFLGCDGFGRSEALCELRRFFEVDAENIALAALVELAPDGKYPQEKLRGGRQTLDLDPNKPNPVTS